MIQSSLSKAKRLHFIGVGGSGMFPIVQIMLAHGYIVSGSDNNEGATIDLERALGVTVYRGHAAEQVAGADMVIFSAAINEQNPERVAAKEQGIPSFERSEILGYLTQQYTCCIAIAGTHGKTTATAMLTQVLVEAGLDPTAVIGGRLPLIGGNGRAGNSEIMTVEACEYVDTFLHLSPDIAVILNVDEDHMEYFKTLDNLKKSFHQFATLATRTIIVNGDDANTMAAIKGISTPVVTYGLAPANDYSACDFEPLGSMSTRFTVLYKGEPLTKLTVNIPGRHNLSNALAVTAAAREAGATPQQIAAYLPNFRGAGRRFEVLGKQNGVTIVDDYAHHPTELRATLEVAKTMGYRKVWAVFQPFTYSRTALFLDDFASALSLADHVVLSEIMGARETNSYNIFTSDLAEKIPGSVWFPKFPAIAEYVMSNAKEGDLVITLGCGDIYKCAQLMLTI